MKYQTTTAKCMKKRRDVHVYQTQIIYWYPEQRFQELPESCSISQNEKMIEKARI